MLRHSRSGLAGLFVIAGAAASTLTVLAFDRVQSYPPVPAGRGYVYYVKEADADHNPIPGRTVTMTVQQAPGPDASVAPSDSNGHPTGPAGQTATEQSGSDGLAYFLIRTSATPGDNFFVWQDGTYSGQVEVRGTGPGGATASPSASETPSPASPSPSSGSTPASRATPVGGGVGGIGGSHGSGSNPGAPAKAHLPSANFPPIAAGLLAAVLTWMIAPPVLARRVFNRAGGATLPASAETR